MFLTFAWVTPLHGSPSNLSITDDPELFFRWSAPVTCPDAVAIRQRIRELRGQPAAASPKIVVHGEVTVDDEQRWHLLLTTERNGVQGERALDGPSCRTLAESAALILALADRPNDPSVTPAPSRPAATVPPARLQPPGLVVGLQSGVDVGTIAAIRPMVGGSFGWQARFFRAEAFVLGGLATTIARLDQAASTNRFSWLLFGIQGCPTYAHRALTFGACLGLNTGTISQRAVGSTNASAPSEATQSLVALHAGPLITWHVAGPLALRANVDGVVPLVRPRFVLAGADDYTSAPVAVRAIFGVEAHF